MTHEVLDVLNYINELMNGLEEDYISLCIIELSNGEKVLCLIDNESIETGDIEELLLPVHIIEYQTNNKVVYTLCPYSNVTSTIAPIYIKDYVLYSFPSNTLISNYQSYWEDYIDKMQLKLSTNNEQFDLLTDTKM